MSKKVKYANGFEGFASDAVAKKLEAKGAAKIIGDAKDDPKPEPKKDAK